MARKKKKSPLQEIESLSVRTTPAKAQEPIDDVPQTDLLLLRLAQPSVGSSKRLDAIPHAFLSEQDAVALDVLPNEDLILLASKLEDTSTIYGAAICRADVGASMRSPSKADGKRSIVAPGSIRVSPSSVVDALFQRDIPLSTGKSILANQESPTRESRKHLVPAETPPPATPSSTPATPSSTPGKFSFAKGGGGDQIYSPPTQPSPSTPNFRSPSKLPPHPVWVVPLESSFGRRLSQILCIQAAKICFKLPASMQDMKNADYALKRIVMAHCVGRYFQCNERVRVSFQGKPLELETVLIEAAPTDNLEDDLGRLSIEDAPSEWSSEEEVLLTALTSSSGVYVYKMTYDTAIDISRQEMDTPAPSSTRKRQHVAGLSSVLEEVRSILLPPLTRPELFSAGSLKPPRGVLLHGPSGVGKSCLANQIAMEMESLADVEYINCASLQSQTAIVGEAEGRLSRLFQPSGTAQKGKLLVFDDIHLICPKRGGYSSGTDRLTATLLALIDGINIAESGPVKQNIVILAITTNPSLLDPALRRPGRIDSEVEVPIPDEASTRAEILQFQLGNIGAKLPDISSDDWMTLGKLAKGFNGADCMLAVKEALRSALLREMTPAAAVDEPSQPLEAQLSLEDLKTAIRHTKPSAIKSITVEIPQVLWSSIGGMDSVKKELREAIELPLTHSELFTQLRVPPPRGILLYGPPGCSKTLMARALATEGNMNFLAVKGPELLSKWLGESERALASLFRRARMASPCIIFFDEVDAIASKRGTGDSASSGRLLSQLLTELDGVNHTGGSSGGKQPRVVVVGATNRPDLLDSALTRPGRIDRMIYVGVPDAASRAKIFELGIKDKSCGDDIDTHSLAQDDISEGFSGAEVVAICRDAALLALEESEELTADSTPKLHMRHLLRAIESMQRQITPEMLDFYASFRNSPTRNL
jgi:SpoVK/Ycf46/Vps4 family AAA+-type ATPase